MNGPTRGVRCHVGLFGRRNVGKSSLLNALAGQDVSIVAPEPGTTTDPVEKAMELLPLGPILLIDTAGLDDEGELGRKRVERTRRMLDRTDLALVIVEGERWGEYERWLLEALRARDVAAAVVFNKADLAAPPPALVEELRAEGLPVVSTVATTGRGLHELRQALLEAAPKDFLEQPSLAGGLVRRGDLVVLVVPIDRGAPRGRLILPQVQTLRDLLDLGNQALVVTDKELREGLAKLTHPPRLVVTDSQAFERVAPQVPPESMLTSFSILFARWKGDLMELVRGIRAVETLRPGDRVLVAEACTHHPSEDDIGRVKLPRWLERNAGGALQFEHVQGHDFPEDPSPYRLVLHCGSCMLGRREVLGRILRCHRAGVPITNYGLCIARLHGVLERALEPFPQALSALREVHRCA